MFKPYFEVTSAEVERRFKSCLVPKSISLDFISEKPDLYGPLWIVATLAVAFSLFGNIARYLFNFNLTIPFRIDLIHKGLVLLYAYAIGAPLILSAVGRGLRFVLDPIQVLST